MATSEPIAESVDLPKEGGMLTTTRLLIWVYLILWIFEGSLRKWYMTSFSDVLLVIRDPIVLLIYLTAATCRGFRMNLFNGAVLVLGVLSVVASAMVNTNMVVTAFGFRANFLHLPLIFVMARVLRPLDIRRMGWLLLVVAVPMALVMAKQYQSDVDDWWNLGAGGGRQILATDNKIRPAGFFSFVAGPILFYTATAALIMAGSTLKNWFRWWLAIPAGAATILAAAVAGSRSLLGALVLTAACFLVGCLLFPRSLKQVLKLGVIAGVVLFLVSFSTAFQEGSATTGDRFTGATRNEGGLSSTVYKRWLEPIVESIKSVMDAPPLGVGLGLGTNAGSALAGGKGFFGENEWQRVVAESGPFLGLAYLFTRLGLMGWLLFKSLGAARAGNLLPIALWASAIPVFAFGQFGQPTALGGAVLLTGFCVAALRISFEETRFAPPVAPEELTVQPTEIPESGDLPVVPVPPTAGRFAQRGSGVVSSSPFDGLPPRRKAVRSAWMQGQPVGEPVAPVPPIPEPKVAAGAFSVRGRSRKKPDEV